MVAFSFANIHLRNGGSGGSETFTQEHLKGAFGLLSKRVNDGEFDVIGFHEFTDSKERYYLRLRLKENGRQFLILLTDNTRILIEDSDLTGSQEASHKPQSLAPAETDIPSERDKTALD